MDANESNATRQPTHNERRFRRLFRNVPIKEVLLCRFSCAYVSDLGLLLQGHMYISKNWICFHSNIFGIEKIIEIPVASVITVSKAHTAKIIPNAVKIKTQSKFYLFGSLMSRDNTYRLLANVTGRVGIPDAEPKQVVKDLDAKVDDNVNSVDDDDVSLSSMSSTSSSGASSGIADSPSFRSSTTKGNDIGSRRVSQSFSEKRPLQGGKLLYASEGTIVQRVQQFISIHQPMAWFFSLPKILMALLLCLALLGLLFLCAMFISLRLIYVQDPNLFWVGLIPWYSTTDMQKYAVPYQLLEKMDSIVDDTLKTMDEAKMQLETLKFKMQNLITESSLPEPKVESAA